MYNDVRVYRVKTTVDIEPRTKFSRHHFWSFKNSWWNINPFINWSNQRLISSYRIKKYFICICKRRQGNILIRTLFSNFFLWEMWSREYAAIILRSCEKKRLFSKGGKKKAFSMGIGVTKMVLFLLLRRWQNVFMWCMIKTTSNMWCVNFTERPAWLVNSWTSMRCNLLPEVYTTPFFSFNFVKPQDFPEDTHKKRNENIQDREKFFFLDSSVAPLLLSAGGNNISNRALNSCIVQETCANKFDLMLKFLFLMC